MRIVERFTRDKSSRYVWGGLTLLCVLVLVFALQAEQRAVDDEIEAANARTVRSANTAVRDIVTAPTLSSTELDFRFRDLLVAAQAAVFTDPTAARMRIWDLEGVLRFSTDQPRADIGSVQVADERVIAAARDGLATSTQTTEPFTQATTGRDGEPTRLLQTFVPLNVGERIEPLGAVQIDYLYDRLVENARDPWLQVQVASAGLLGLFALLTILSLRAPLSRTAPASTAATLPAAETPADADARPSDEDTVLREELELAREQLQQAEEAYRYLETRLKKTQEDLTRSGAEPSPETAQQIASVQRDREMAEARAELAEQRLAEMQQRLDRQVSDPSAPPAVVREAAPVTTPEPVSSQREPEPTAEPDAPERQPEPVGAAAADGEPPADPASDLRARLARTAARKKLGPNIGD